MTLALSLAAEKYGAEIHTFVLMSNHYHLLLSTPLANLDEVMRYFQSRSTQFIQKASGRINHIYGGRYHWTLLEGAYELAYVYKYVYRNPVRGGICGRVEDYAYSTINQLDTPLPLSEGFGPYWKAIPKLESTRFDWLNVPTPKEQEELIGRALKHYQFAFTSNSNLQSKLRQLRASYGVEPEDMPRHLLLPKVD